MLIPHLLVAGVVEGIVTAGVALSIIIFKLISSVKSKKTELQQ